MEHLGELAAFGTATCYSFSAIFFESATRRVGTLAVNFYKVLAAFVLLMVAGTVVRGVPVPVDAPLRAWLFLGLSGLVGFVVADHFLFTAYLLVGSRSTVVFQALTPLFTFFLGWFVLGERVRFERLAAMILVIAGILMVVRSRNSGAESSRPRDGSGAAAGAGTGIDRSSRRKGYFSAFLSSIFQAMGLILSKTGLGSYSAISGSQIRLLAAIAGFGIQAVIIGQANSVFVKARRDRGAMRLTLAGGVLGPFLGVTLSLFALQRTQAGPASTLMALTPVLIIPASIIMLKQKVRPMEIAGAVLAVSGAALFFLL